MHRTARIELARLPTPLQRADRLEEAWAAAAGECPEIWIKRDDLTGFGVSGNKVRKLEYHLAAAIEAGASTIVTCGAIQSNHCRTTALAAAGLGLRTALFLRTPQGSAPETAKGNYLLMRLAGANCRFITPQQWADRDGLMSQEANRIGDAWVIPEGASDAIGALGFVDAAHELAAQLEDFDRSVTIWHPASSAGTTAGLVRGAGDVSLEAHIVGCSVGDPAADVTAHVEEILAGFPDATPPPVPYVQWSITDAYVGGGYAVAGEQELAVQAAATRLTGMLFDPTYTGKALYGLYREVIDGRLRANETVVFWHTGGGFATFAYDWAPFLS